MTEWTASTRSSSAPASPASASRTGGASATRARASSSRGRRRDRRLLQDGHAGRLRLGLLGPLLPLQAPDDRGLAARAHAGPGHPHGRASGRFIRYARPRHRLPVPEEHPPAAAGRVHRVPRRPVLRARRRGDAPPATRLRARCSTRGSAGHRREVPASRTTRSSTRRDLDTLDDDAMGRFFPHADLADIVRNMRPGADNATATTRPSPIPRAARSSTSRRWLARSAGRRGRAAASRSSRSISTRKVATHAEARDRVRAPGLVGAAAPRSRDRAASPHDPAVFTWNKVLVFNLGFDRKGPRGVHWMYFPDRARLVLPGRLLRQHLRHRSHEPLRRDRLRPTTRAVDVAGAARARARRSARARASSPTTSSSPSTRRDRSGLRAHHAAPRSPSTARLARALAAQRRVLGRPLRRLDLLLDRGQHRRGARARREARRLERACRAEREAALARLNRGAPRRLVCRRGFVAAGEVRRVDDHGGTDAEDRAERRRSVVLVRTGVVEGRIGMQAPRPRVQRAADVPAEQREAHAHAETREAGADAALGDMNDRRCERVGTDRDVGGGLVLLAGTDHEDPNGGKVHAEDERAIRRHASRCRRVRGRRRGVRRLGVGQAREREDDGDDGGSAEHGLGRTRSVPLERAGGAEGEAALARADRGAPLRLRRRGGRVAAGEVRRVDDHRGSDAEEHAEDGLSARAFVVVALVVVRVGALRLGVQAVANHRAEEREADAHAGARERVAGAPLHEVGERRAERVRAEREREHVFALVIDREREHADGEEVRANRQRAVGAHARGRWGQRLLGDRTHRRRRIGRRIGRRRIGRIGRGRRHVDGGGPGRDRRRHARRVGDGEGRDHQDGGDGGGAKHRPATGTRRVPRATARGQRGPASDF